MYIRSIEIENTGPIEWVRIRPPFENEKPKPLILVGKNGSGKSIFISYLVSALISAKQTVFDNLEVQENRVYKYRSPLYIKHGKPYFRANVEFDDEIEQHELQLRTSRKQFEELNEYYPLYRWWDKIPSSEYSGYGSTFLEKKEMLTKHLNETVQLYFPPNRFEEPAWLNRDNLVQPVEYLDYKRVSGNSNRDIINTAPLKTNQQWLLDVIYDSHATELKTNLRPGTFEIAAVREGPATGLLKSVEIILSSMLGVERIAFRWGVGTRGARSIQLSQNGEILLQNLFSLSTGQTALLNIFLTIIRHADISSGNYKSLDEIRGIVIVDEIDLHLHTDLQRYILPKLLKLFPSVQFILTTHSPLFLLGMEREFEEGGYEIIELPSGTYIQSERFTEFEEAYKSFQQTAKYEGDVRDAVEASSKPILFVEGDIDIDLLVRAADLLGYANVIKKFTLKDARGFGGLDKIWKSLDSRIADVLHVKVILLYDCDTEKKNENKLRVFKRVMPSRDHPIKKGIENLFDGNLIAAAREENAKFFDVFPSHNKIERGVEMLVAESLEINKHEKRNFANWILQRNNPDDFKHFCGIFDLIGRIQIN